jgi:hypothetical protein
VYPFPPKDEIVFLVGDTLTAVCLNPSNVNFIFESGSCINAEYAIAHEMSADVSHRYDVQQTLGPGPLYFHQLVGKQVLNLVVAETTLKLEFDNGEALIIEGDIGPYESGQISRGKLGEPDFIFIVF